MARVLLTGASGFLGTRLLPRLSAAGHDVTALIHDSVPPEPPAGVTVVRGDLLEPDTYRRALDGCEVVVHAAALTGKGSPGAFRAVNVRGTAALLDESLAAGVRRFVFVSSIAAAYRRDFGYYYAHAKRRGEALVSASPLETVITRPTIIAGPGAPVLDGLRTLATLPVIPLFGPATTRVQPIHVDDLATALTALVVEPEPAIDAYEFGGPETVSVADLLRRLRQAAGLGPARFFRVPFWAVAPALAGLEPLLRSVLPVTAGQLALFRNDGTARENLVTSRLRAGWSGLDAMLEPAASIP